MADLLLNNFSIDDVTSCHLRCSSRAKRMRIELRPDRSLLIVIPRGTREDQWLAFVLGKRQWIQKNLEKVRSNFPQQQFDGEQFPDQLDLLLTGQCIALLRRTGNRNKTKLEQNVLLIQTTMDDDKVAFRLLREWLRTAARNELSRRLDVIARDTGLQWNRLSIRGQKTRWGSCSAKANISLNYKLLFLPAALVDHVLIHELVHTLEMNHSARFWSLMHRHDPDCARNRAGLSQAGRMLPGWLEML